MIDLATLKWKVGGAAALLVVTFAAGRYTMRTAVEKEMESKYEKIYVSTLEKLEERFSEKLKESVETIQKEVQTASERENDVDETIVVGADGSHNITRKIRSRESNKTNTVIKTEIKVVEVEKVIEKVVTVDRVVEVEKKVEVIKEVSVPPPSWRAYGIASLRSPTDEQAKAYGAGAMYDLGPVNVGGFGTYSPDVRDTTVGLTVGVSF